MSTAAAEVKGPTARPRLSTISCLRESLSFLDHRTGRVAALVLLLCAGAALPVVYAAAMKRGLDSLYSTTSGSFAGSIAILFASFLAGGSLAWVGATLRLNMIETIAVEQRKRILGAAISMPLKAFERSQRGDLVSRLTADVDQSSRIFTGVYLTLDVALRAAAAISYVVFLNWRVGVATIAASLLVILATKYSNGPIPEKGRAYQATLGGLSAEALNSLEGIAVVKSFCAEIMVKKSFARRLEHVFSAGVSLARSTLVMRATSGFTAFLPTITAFGYGGYMAAIGQLSPGAVLATMNLSDSISILVFLGLRWSEVQRSVGAYERVREAMMTPPDFAPGRPAGSQGGTGATTGTPTRQGIRVSHLCFEYEPGRPVLRDISFEIPAGTRLAIVGKSGCGKSTLLKVLAGLYPAGPGEVMLDGLDMHYDRLSAGRKHAVYVPQEPFLLSGTVRDNLKLAREDAGDEDLALALEAADSAAFVKELHGGLDSQVGENGDLLSGGQRQRLCLARGLLRHAPILLLDEPTSSLDKESEAKVIEAMSRMEGFTSVTVTHRAALAEASDRIIVMDGGRIVESGTHAELMANRSLYWTFHEGETSFSQSPSTTPKSVAPDGRCLA